VSKKIAVLRCPVGGALRELLEARKHPAFHTGGADTSAGPPSHRQCFPTVPVLTSALIVSGNTVKGKLLCSTLLFATMVSTTSYCGQ
jgi:hypothetical protein